jgi:hypothetical protein
MADLLDTLRTAGFEIVDRSHLGFFLFPGFWLVKKRNRHYLNASPRTRRKIVRRDIGRYRSSPLMHSIMLRPN